MSPSDCEANNQGTFVSESQPSEETFVGDRKVRGSDSEERVQFIRESRDQIELV